MSISKKVRGNESYLIILLSCIPLLLHLYVNAFAGYGYFRDELYYIACSNRLDSGYVDQPPLSIFILSLSRLLFGESMFAVRLLPAITSGLTVFFTGLMVLKMNGKKYAVVISSLAVIFAPVYLGMFSIYSMNCFDILLWTIASYLVVLIVEESKPSYWILLGIVAGLGLLNKIGFLWFCFSFFIGLIITNKRKELLTAKPYITGLIALAIFLPYLIWNFNNDYAHLEFIKNATSGKYSDISRIDFVLGQFLNMNPASSIVWLSGLYYFLIDDEGKKFKILGIIYLISFLILVINGHSKAEYLAAAYPMLFAGGGVFLEKITALKFKWIRYASALFILLFGILVMPLALPVLPVETYVKYTNVLGIAPSTSESKELAELPQFYADMFGWEEMARNVSMVYLSLSQDERNRALVFGNNYGEAGAMEFYSKKYSLPKTISSHNSYWIWGYPETEDPVVILIGGDDEDHLRSFTNVEKILVHTALYSMPYENNIAIYIGRNLKRPLKEIWNEIKNYN